MIRLLGRETIYGDNWSHRCIQFTATARIQEKTAQGQDAHEHNDRRGIHNVRLTTRWVGARPGQGWLGSGGGTHVGSNKKFKIFTWKEFNTRNFEKGYLLGYHFCIKQPNIWRNIFWRIYQNNTCSQGFKSPPLIRINLYQASPMEKFANEIWIYSKKSALNLARLPCSGIPGHF